MTALEAPRDNLLRSVAFELERDEGSDGLTLSGHAAVFNSWTTIDSWEGKFKERIAPGAFKKTLAESGSRVRLQFDHGSHPLVGSLPIGAIRKLKEDRRGLFVEARLADNWLVQPVRDAIDNGSIDGMSFRFKVVNETWESVDTDLPERTITEVQLLELGPVVWPAYDKTDVGVRELARSLFEADDATRRELAAVLYRAPQEILDTPDDEAATEGTSDDGAVNTDEPTADGHSRSGDDESPFIKPAVRPSLTPDRLESDLAAVNARIAAAASA